MNSFNHSKLSVLDISSNQITKWESIQTLSSLPSLHTLFINGNPLLTDDLHYDFPSIHFLDVNDMNISSIEQLQTLIFHFPALTELEVRRNPFYIQEPAREVRD